MDERLRRRQARSIKDEKSMHKTKSVTLAIQQSNVLKSLARRKTVKKEDGDGAIQGSFISTELVSNPFVGNYLGIIP